MRVPYVRSESEIEKNNSTIYSPLSTQPTASSDGIVSSSASFPEQKDGKSFAENVISSRPLKKEQGGVEKSFPEYGMKMRVEASKGLKFDDNKPPLAYIPKAALDAEGAAFAHGAKKYDAWNYKNGLAVTRTISAALRHISQFLDGEDIDSESGAHHLGCARAGLAMALDTLKNHPELDDRFKGGKK